MLYLFISGDMMKPSGWLLSIEGHVVMGPHPFFLHGVAAFFSSYYVFNLEYPAAGSSTLEFIQRYFIKITFNLVIHIIVQASNSMIVLRFKMLTNEVPEVSLVRPSWSSELIQFRSADQSGFLHMLCWQIPAGPITAIYFVLGQAMWWWFWNVYCEMRMYWMK